MRYLKKANLIFFIAIFVLNIKYVYANERYSAQYKDQLFKMVVPTRTMATVIEDCFLRQQANYFAPVESSMKEGALVEILEDYSEKWYKVYSSDEDTSGWLAAKCLEIHSEERAKLPEMSKEELEAFANIMNFPTNSDYFIWTDIARQKTHIFKKSDGFALLETFVCSTGKSASPTTRGFFVIKGRGKWFYSARMKSGGMYWVRFNGSYLFHSQAMDKNKKIIDAVLGERRSSGCVRLSLHDAEWLYKNIPDGTSVFIH